MGLKKNLIVYENYGETLKTKSLSPMVKGEAFR